MDSHNVNHNLDRFILLVIILVAIACYFNWCQMTNTTVVMPRGDRHKLPQINVRLPKPYNWFLRLLADHDERPQATVLVRALRHEMARLGLWPIPDKVFTSLSETDFKDIAEFKKHLERHNLWPPSPAEGEQ